MRSAKAAHQEPHPEAWAAWTAAVLPSDRFLVRPGRRRSRWMESLTHASCDKCRHAPTIHLLSIIIHYLLFMNLWTLQTLWQTFIDCWSFFYIYMKSSHLGLGSSALPGKATCFNQMHFETWQDMARHGKTVAVWTFWRALCILAIRTAELLTPRMGLVKTENSRD